MKNNAPLLLLIILLTIVSCSKKNEYGIPNANLKSLETDFMKWWVYHNNDIRLSSDFTPIDNSSNVISKEDFLKNLTSGDFIPLKLKSKDSTANYYKLFKLDPSADEGIRRTIKAVSLKDYKHFKMEGKSFPEFNFTDLNGTLYNNENTKGKIIILKCWFLSCKPCIAEFPELNNLVEKYKNRKDVLFLSLAFESKEDIKSFLLKKPFDYAVVPDQKEFMEDILNIGTYPTHFIIDKNGIIKKVVNKVDEMILILEEKELLITGDTKSLPPPPPPPPPAALSK